MKKLSFLFLGAILSGSLWAQQNPAAPAATPNAPAPIPMTQAPNYAVLPFEKFAPDLPPALKEDGTPNTIWYRAEMVYMETTDAPPNNASITSVPSIPQGMLDSLKVHHFSPMLGMRYAYTDFLWIDRNPIGKLLKKPIPYGTIFYFAVEKEKNGYADIQVYFYQTENLRWEDPMNYKFDKDGELEHDGTFIPVPTLHNFAERVNVKLGAWTLFLASVRVEEGVPSGGMRQDKTYYGYVGIRLRPSIIVKQTPEAIQVR